MSGNNLNKKQRQWVNDFMSAKPNASMTLHWKDLDDHVVVIEWWDSSNALIHSSTVVRRRIDHRIRIKLSRAGHPKTSEYSYEIKPPQKEDLFYSPTGQLTLDLPQNYNSLPPSSPVTIKPKKKNFRKNKKSGKITQQALPLFGASAQLLEINLKDSGGAVLSEQSLLSETMPHKTLDGKEIKLPAAIVKILKQKKASFREWENAIDLYQVAGPSAVLKFLEGLDFLREHFGTNVKQSIERVEKNGTQSVTIHG